MYRKGFPGRSMVKNLSANAGDTGWIPWPGRPSGERNGNPLQHFCLGNPMDRAAWWATVHGVARVGHDLLATPPPPPNKCQLQPQLLLLNQVVDYDYI